MGYTHRYILLAEPTGQQVAAVAADVRGFIDLAGIPLGDGTFHETAPGSGYLVDGTEPVVTDQCIKLNGLGYDGCESFWFPVDAEYRELREAWGIDPNAFFCKTARQPYDVVVFATIIALKHHLGEGVVVGTDGFSDHDRDIPDDSQLDAGYDLYRRATGRELPEFFRQQVESSDAALARRRVRERTPA